MGSIAPPANGVNIPDQAVFSGTQGGQILTKRVGPNAPGIAFVTGGARGLGNAIAVSFAREGARAVVIVDIQGAEICEAGRKTVEAYGTEV